MTDHLPSKERDEAFVKLVAILQTSAYSAGASGGNAGLDTMTSSRAAIIDCYAQLERKLDTCGLQCSATMKSLLAEVDKLNADMAWIRRRTGFWGEVPQATPASMREAPHCPTCACGAAPPPGDG